MDTRILVVAADVETRANLAGRLYAAAHDAQVQIVVFEASDLDELEPAAVTTFAGCVFAPGESAAVGHAIDTLRSRTPAMPIGVALPPSTYQAAGFALAQQLAVTTFATTDLPQLARYLHNCATLTPGRRSPALCIGVAQCKGGVGATTIAASLAACWAQHNHTVALVDLDDVTPTITLWSGAGQTQRRAIGRALQTGQIAPEEMAEALFRVPQYAGNLTVLPQPLLYGESFHHKTNALPEAPSVDRFWSNVLPQLRANHSIIVIDLGRSWGLSSLSLLRDCDRVIGVLDDSASGVEGGFETLVRISAESDHGEFDWTRWGLVLNGTTGANDQSALVERKAQALLPSLSERDLVLVPLSRTGRDWSRGDTTLYECGDSATREMLRLLAHMHVPFVYQSQPPGRGSFWQSLHRTKPAYAAPT